jgi:hypothetical protein
VAGPSTDWNQTLLKMAKPDIYRINAFRLLNVPITASTKEISSLIRRNELLSKYSDGPKSAADSLLPNLIEISSDDINKALHRISDPELRFIDEFFWFWPISSVSEITQDEALSAFYQHNIAKAVSIWEKQEVDGSQFNVSTHNLAVFYHAMALEYELLESNKVKLSEKDLANKKAYWAKAFKRWKHLQDEEFFWKRLEQRIVELADPRISKQNVSNIREGLPAIVLLINAILAIEAAEMNDIKDRDYHISLMRASGFGMNTINEAAHQAIVPQRTRIKMLCEEAKEQTEKTPEKGFEIADKLQRNALATLSIIDTLLPEADSTKISSRDEIALQMKSSINSAFSKTENLNKALELENKTLQVAASASIKNKIQEDIDTIEKALVFHTCWFCGKAISTKREDLNLAMHGNVQTERRFTGTNYKWQKLDVPIPRCRKCANAHRTRAQFGCGGLVTGAALGIFLGFVLQEQYHGVVVAIVTFGIIAVTGYFLAWATFPQNVKPESHAENFPHVKQLISQGWKVGEKPQGVR